MKTNCIVCDTEVENWDEAYPDNESQIHPIGGTMFHTYGHYGSTVFDPMDGWYLLIVVCDECLKTRMTSTHAAVESSFVEQFDQSEQSGDRLVESPFDTETGDV